MSQSSGARRWIHPKDLALSLVILALVAFFAYQSTTFEEVSALFDGGVTPEYFPRLILWVIGILAVLMPFEHAVRVARSGGSGLEEDRKATVKPIAWITMAVALAIVTIAPWLGTYLTLIAVCLALPLLWGERRWGLILGFGFGFPTVVMLVFTQVFKIYFEPGVLGLSFH